jgi:putative SOS response-associated peptidase YedK
VAACAVVPARETLAPNWNVAPTGDVWAVLERAPRGQDDDDPAAWLMTCTIITAEAADAASRVHPRMPFALTPEHYGAWLDPDHQDPDELRALLGRPTDGHLDARPVSTAVNNVRNNGPQLLDKAVS